MLVLPTNSRSSDALYSDIKSDEVVVFFRTSAWLDTTQQAWHIPIHGWIYEPEDSVARKTLFSSILENEYGLSPSAATDANFTRRINLMIADNERGKKIIISIAGANYSLTLSATNGHFESTLVIPIVDLEEFIENGCVRFSALSRANDPRVFTGEVLLVEPTGLSIVSDIDDTVKVSNVTDRKSLLENTFLLDFQAVPEMAELYEQWTGNGASLHFVSSSPWQLYEPLEEFLHDAGFPPSAVKLKPVRFRDKTLFDLFKKGTETKPRVIEDILGRYPKRQFILVGDSGEQDPEVYAGLLRKYSEQIKKAYIRNVTQETADNARFASVFEGIDEDRWQLFDQPLLIAN